MTVASYALGAPPAAAMRGGDCRARDLGQTPARNVYGPHRFAAPDHCRISNGLLRLTVATAGATPALTIEARRGAVVVGDFYSDTYSDTYPGHYSTPEWIALGTLTIDSPTLTAALTDVGLISVSAEAVTIALVSDVGLSLDRSFVTLRRGERQCRIQHGSTRPPLVSTTRRIAWTASPSLVGTARTGRVEETTDAIAGMVRFVASIDPVTAGAFSLTSAATNTARFGAGVGSGDLGDTPVSMHGQLRDASRPQIVVETA